jgi:hypothetical protein
MRASKSQQHTPSGGDGDRLDTRFDDDNQTSHEHESCETEPPAYDSPPDRRAKYALQIQRASDLALRKLEQNPLLQDSEWCQPLLAAPTAISVMAFLLKAAADKRVAGLEISSLEVKDDKGSNTIGKLPYVRCI